MFDVRFDQIISIGDNCGCAMLLKEVGLRMCSSPFDWITGAGFKQRILTLSNRFEDFLQFENVVWHEVGREDRANDVYRDKLSGYLFIHDFPKRISLADSFPKVREKYQRRIRRLLGSLDDGRSVCLIWRTLQASPLTDEVCEWAMRRIATAFPGAHCRLLVIENDPSVNRVLYQTCADGHCVRVRGRFLSSGGDVLTGDVDSQIRILKRLRKSGALTRRIWHERLIRGVARFLSLWHVDREGRKLARERWTRRFRRADGAAVGW